MPLVAVLIACGSTGPKTTTGIVEPQADRVWGTAAPYSVVAVPPDGRWAVICQARSDTNEDGKVRVFYEIHGEYGGDEMVAYLIDPDGREAAIDNVLAVDPKGRWLAIVEGGAPVLIDTVSGKHTPLVGTLPQYRIKTGMHRWEFDPTGKRLLYFRDGAPIVRELESGEEITIAPAAWRAWWSIDGAWVVMDHLAGDTDGDGFIHGPDLSPGEGIPGINCGHKMDWGMVLYELLPMDSTNQQDHDRAMASLNRADKLDRTLWRASDRRRVPAQEPVDHDTVITAIDGVLVVTPVGEQTGVEIGPVGCIIGAVLPETRSIVFTCPKPGGTGGVAWWLRDGKRRELMPTEDADPLVEGTGTGFFAIYPGQLIGDLRTGAEIARDKKVFLTWSDAERVLIGQEDERAELRWPDGKHIALSRERYGYQAVAGHFLMFGSTVVDLDRREVKRLDVTAIEVRSDGAVLVDGGEQPTEGDEYSNGPRIGPLRWATVR